MGKIKLGISSCLLGENVRYDGTHKLDLLLRDDLGAYVDFVSVCPEVECGLGVPRESMRLEGEPENPRLITTGGRQDRTDLLVNWSRKRLAELAGQKLCGFVFKRNSPCCGLQHVKIYCDSGAAVEAGAGIFARLFSERFPELPVEDEACLRDTIQREIFIGRIFAVNR